MKTNSLKQLLETHKLVIPPIQRDYAQGRNTGKIPHIRTRFLDAIVDALINEKADPLELDFVYGYIETDNAQGEEVSVFKPLDGQQRLTTLFLIHWFVAHNEGKIDEAKVLLSKFSYATRQSSRSFCEKLIEFIPVLGSSPVSEQIINQPWFYYAWNSDPTIAGMLVMLREIELKFQGLENGWQKLTGANPKIIFHLLPMEHLGLPDDLYIKMNARGKGLTDFEHFKSQFSDLLDEPNAKIFNEKIDGSWSDLFWNIFKEKKSVDIAREVDNGFLSFFWYITDILISKNKIKCESDFWLDVIRSVYQNNSENIKFLIDSLMLFERLEKEKAGYFNEIFYIKPEDFSIGKTRIFFINPQTNLFRKCAEVYGFGDKVNTFSVAEQLLLYAFIYMHLKTEAFDESKFRVLRNIFASSEDQLRSEYLGSFLYTDVEVLVLSNKYSNGSKLSKRQLEEEEKKQVLVKNYPQLKETVYRLEDHFLLRGNIALFDFDETIVSYAQRFHQIFISGCDYYAINKSMLTLGDYTQSYGKFRRYGNQNNATWREIFTQSESRGDFNCTKTVLKTYLDVFSREGNVSATVIIDKYLQQHKNNPLYPKDLFYYYIKYQSFTLWDGNTTEGFYWWEDRSSKPYECWMLFKRQFNGRHWSPFLLELSVSVQNCSIEHYGSPLQFTYNEIVFLIYHANNGFRFTVIANDDKSEAILTHLITKGRLNADGVLLIKQNDSGVDIEDRIEKAQKFLDDLKSVIELFNEDI